jgi:hypothetical protein
LTPVVTWEAYEFRPIEEMKVEGPGETADQPADPGHPVNAVQPDTIRHDEKE